MVNSISFKQVLYYYKSRINESELWCILLASLQDQYKKLKSDPSLCANTLDISSDTVLLQSDGEINIISYKENNKKSQSFDDNFESRFINSLGCFLSYLIKLNDNSISDELRTLVAYMVNEANEITFSLIFEETYRYSCLHLDSPYQKVIKKLFEKTLQRILDANQRNELENEEFSNDTINNTTTTTTTTTTKNKSKVVNYSITNNTTTQSLMDGVNNRTSGDGQSNPDISDVKLSHQDYEHQTLATVTVNSSNAYAGDISREQKKFLNLIEKVKKRKLKLKQLRSKLNINVDDDSNSEFEGINEIILFQQYSSSNQNETTVNDESNYNSKLVRANETMNSSIGANTSEKLRQIPTKKFYDIRRIPPLLKFDDPLENITKDPVNVVVKLITESKFEFKCSGQSTCKQIFEYIIAYLDLTEQNLFGLFIYCDGEYYFVDLDEKLHKVVSKWRRKDLAKDSIELYLKIKIYLTDINSLHDPLTLQFYYWELRRQFTSGFYCDINDDKISPTDELPLLFQLAVLAFHAEGGELNEFNYLYDNYIPEKYLTEVSLFEIQLGELYKLLSTSQTNYQSLVQFTNLIIGHKNYGYHFFHYHASGSNNSNSINNSNNSLSGSFSEKTNQNYVGISLNGISVFKLSQLEEQHRQHYNTVFYKWQQIEKLICERKKIFIQLRGTIEQQQQKRANKYSKIYININSEKKAKSIVKLSQSLSRFAMAIEQRYLNKISAPTTLFEAYSDTEEENHRFSASLSNENLNLINTSGNVKDKSLSIYQPQPSQSQLQLHQNDDTYLLKDILKDEDSSYIKVFDARKTKKQKFGITLDENKAFNCKSIKQVSPSIDSLAKNTNLAVGDLILCINNEIKFNELTCKQLENYLDSYIGPIRLLLLSKENVERLLLAQAETPKESNKNLASDEIRSVSEQRGESPGELLLPKAEQYKTLQQLQQQNEVIFEESDETCTNYNTASQLITKMTNSQLFDKLSIKSSIISEQDSVDFELMNLKSKNKSLKALLTIGQQVQNDDPGTPQATNTHAALGITNILTNTVNNIDENFIKVDLTKTFKVTLLKNSNNELGFTVTKLPNGYSCIKEILHEPALANRFIQTGDIIVSVNNSSTKSLSHRDVVSFLRISASNVELELFRPDPAIILPYLNQRKQKQYLKSLNNHNEQEEDDEDQQLVSHQEQQEETGRVSKQVEFEENSLQQDEQLSQQEEIIETLRDNEDEKVNHDDTITENTEKDHENMINYEAPKPNNQFVSNVLISSINSNVSATSSNTAAVATKLPTSRLLEFEYTMKDFLRLNLILSTEKLDENDDEESLIGNINKNLNNTNGLVPKVSGPNQSLNSSSTSLLYVKSIKKFDNEGDVEKNLQQNDLIIKFNGQIVNTLEEFKLMLYNLNKKFLATNIPQTVCLTVKRRSFPKTQQDEIQNSANNNDTIAKQQLTEPQNAEQPKPLGAHNNIESLISFGGSYHTGSNFSLNYTQNHPQTDDLNDVNITVGSNRRGGGLDDSMNNAIEPNEIQNFKLWFLAPNFTQFFFPLYSNETIITEEYLNSYNNFNNLDMYRLESLFEVVKNKILSKTQDYIQEFKLLKTTSVIADSSKIANYNEENRSKNRFRNVVPYDYNRVKLIDSPSNNDYINASHICLPLHTSQKNDQQYVTKFIIAQPPLNNTINDFLLMIWEQNIHLIVKLLTNDEINKLKCPKYWPTKETPTKEFLPYFQLTLVSCQNLDDHIFISYCELHNLKTNQQRNIFICQYTDEIINLQTQANELTYFNQYNRLQTFMNLIHIYHQKGPLLIYCLTGLGRTGLFLCIYYNLTLFKTDFYANSTNTNFIFDTVKLLRSQRYGVIQTKEQYKYCYTFFLQLFSQKLQALSNQMFQS